MFADAHVSIRAHMNVIASTSRDKRCELPPFPDSSADSGGSRTRIALPIECKYEYRFTEYDYEFNALDADGQRVVCKLVELCVKPKYYRLPFEAKPETEAMVLPLWTRLPFMRHAICNPVNMVTNSFNYRTKIRWDDGLMERFRYVAGSNPAQMYLSLYDADNNQYEDPTPSTKLEWADIPNWPYPVL